MVTKQEVRDHLDTLKDRALKALDGLILNKDQEDVRVKLAVMAVVQEYRESVNSVYGNAPPVEVLLALSEFMKDNK